jgi:hypothetical protein
MARKKAEAADTPSVDTHGQITLPLGGYDYVLRPSIEAIEAIERQLRPLAQLEADAAGFSLPIRDMAVIAAEMMRAHAVAKPNDPKVASYKGADPDKLVKLIYEEGAPKVCVRLYVVLSGALSGGYTATGEAKAGTPEE